MKYSIDTKLKIEEDFQIILNIKQTIHKNEAYGDQIGLCKEDNVLWFDYMLDLKDEHVIEFIENNFIESINSFLTIKSFLIYFKKDIA